MRIEAYRKWKEFQITPELINGIDHLESSTSSKVSKDGEVRKALNWINTSSSIKKIRLQKGTIFDFLDYKFEVLILKKNQFPKQNDQKGPS